VATQQARSTIRLLQTHLATTISPTMPMRRLLNNGPFGVVPRVGFKPKTPRHAAGSISYISDSEKACGDCGRCSAEEAIGAKFWLPCSSSNQAYRRRGRAGQSKFGLSAETKNTIILKCGITVLTHYPRLPSLPLQPR